MTGSNEWTDGCNPNCNNYFFLQHVRLVREFVRACLPIGDACNAPVSSLLGCVRVGWIVIVFFIMLLLVAPD